MDEGDIKAPLVKDDVILMGKLQSFIRANTDKGFHQLNLWRYPIGAIKAIDQKRMWKITRRCNARLALPQ
jgi:hypothetical protein